MAEICFLRAAGFSGDRGLVGDTTVWSSNDIVRREWWFKNQDEVMINMLDLLLRMKILDQ